MTNALNILSLALQRRSRHVWLGYAYLKIVKKGNKVAKSDESICLLPRFDHS